MPKKSERMFLTVIVVGKKQATDVKDDQIPRQSLTVDEGA